MLKIKPNRINTTISFAFAVILILFTVFWSVRSMQIADTERKYQKRLEETIGYCSGLFDEDNALEEEVGLEELADCEERLAAMNAEEEGILELREYVEDAKKYLAWNEKADEFFDENNNVVETISVENLNELEKEKNALKERYQESTNEKYTALKNGYNAMDAARNAVKNLFKNGDLKNVRGNVNRKDYNDAKAKVDALKQDGFKKELNEPLKKVLEYVEEQEKIAREKAEAARKAEEERRKKIAASWHRLNISPYYINQVSEHYLNGCEAASLLMAMKYKGYLRGMSFKTFADGVPLTDDPNTGFYMSMKELEPKTEAHWIAPAPLAAYGRANGGNVVDATGWSLDRLDNEIKNGNPVVIYLTYAFRNPKEVIRGVPKNLHVMVLSGYNSYTGEHEFYDPWPANGKNPSLSKSRTAALYRASGYRAVVVR